MLLAACAPSAPSSGSEASGEAGPAAGAAAPEGVAVQFWTGWGELVPFFDELKDTDEFRELMGTNDVVMKPTVKTEALLTAIAAGTPPDITSEAPYQDLMAREVLLPIDEWVNASSLIKRDDFIQGNWDRGYYQNVQYGVPAWECFVRFGLDYNARMIEAAGLDPDNPPVTWDDALEWHKALTQFDDAGNLLQIGLDPYDAEGGGIGDGFLAARSWGFDWFDEETGEFNLDNPKMADAFEVMGEFYRIAGPDNMAGMRSVEGQDTWGGSFNAEVQAMIIEGYWHPGETMAQKPEVGKYNRATWVPVPEDRRGAKIQGTGGHYVIFFKDAPNAQAGFPFAEYLTTNTACNLLFDNVGWLPAYKPYLDQADASKYPGLDFYFQSVKDATEMEPPKNCPITSFVYDTYSQLREEVYRDKMTGAEAAAEFQKRCDQEWQDAGFAT
jgi:maltose-binding protein MalE